MQTGVPPALPLVYPLALTKVWRVPSREDEACILVALCVGGVVSGLKHSIVCVGWGALVRWVTGSRFRRGVGFG